jgi:arylsulfatase A-like enzyme
MRARRLLVCLGAALLVAASAACRPDCTPTGGAATPSVLLVTIDTLRADHLGCYGSTTVRTPHLDRLAADGARFTRSYAQTHVTVPSHLTLLSSLPLAVHGIRRNDSPPPGRLELLPDIFAQRGYRTAAFVGVALLGPEGPLGPALTGFQVHEAPRRGELLVRAEETNRRFFRWLRGACREPFFAWVHYYDPHMPYAPPPPYDTAYYHDDPRDQRYTSMRGVTLGWFFHDLHDLRPRLARRAGEVRALKRELGLSTRRVRRLILEPIDLGTWADGPEAEARLRARLGALAASLRAGLPLRPRLADWLAGVRDVRYPRAEYAGEVSYVDDQVGRLRREIERLGLAGRVILVVTADHGELLGEHGVHFDHVGLLEPSLRVPLIVWAPGRVPPGRHDTPARGLDVAPTVLALTGLPAPASMQGRDLLAPAAGDRPVIAEAARGRQLMVRDGRWKLIRTLESFYYIDTFARQAGDVELYDLDADPAEDVNRAAEHPDVAAALGRTLDDWRAALPAAADGGGGPVPAGLERQLRALGYVE